MRHKWLVGLAGGILAALCLSSVAFAGGGGFQVVYHTGPAWIMVDQPTVIRFHVDSVCTDGPVSDLTAQLDLTNLADGSRLRVMANPASTPGDYQAAVSFPTVGEWSWHLVGGEYPQQTAQLINVVSAPVAMTTIATLRPLLRTLVELRVIVGPMSLDFTPSPMVPDHQVIVGRIAFD